MKKIITSVLALVAISLSVSAETSLRDQLVGKYEGTTQGYDYVATSGGYYNKAYNSDIPAVVITAGEGDNDVIIENLFEAQGDMKLTALKGTVVASDQYEGYQGYIEVPVQTIGTGTFYGEERTLTFGKTDWSYSKDLENPSYFYIYNDGSIETDYYASVFYPYVYGETTYTYWAIFHYSKLTKINANKELRDQLVGKYKYKGTTQGYDYVATSGGYYNKSYNTDIPAVVITAGEGDEDVTIENLFEAQGDMKLTSLKGTVVATDQYEGYQGYIEVPVQTAGTGTFYGEERTLTFGKTDWSYVKDLENPSYFYIYNDGTIETDYYASLFYPYVYGETTYTYWAIFHYSSLTKISEEGGVEAVEADNSAYPVEYYNLSGVKVNANNVSTGLYIKRQGNKVEKVIIK